MKSVGSCLLVAKENRSCDTRFQIQELCRIPFKFACLHLEMPSTMSHGNICGDDFEDDTKGVDVDKVRWWSYWRYWGGSRSSMAPHW